MGIARRGGGVGVDVAVAAAAAPAPAAAATIVVAVVVAVIITIVVAIVVVVVVVVDQAGITQSIAPTPTPATTRCKDSAVSITFLRACVKPCNKCKESNVTNTGLHTFQNIKNADVALGIRTAQHVHTSVTRFILELATKTARCQLPMTARASKTY